MEKVTGRSDDMMILRGVNVFPTQIEEILLAYPWFGGHFQIVLTTAGRMDQMAVRAEARPGRWDGAGMPTEARSVVEVIKSTVGVSTSVVVEPPGAIGRSLGKAQRVVDNRARMP